MKMIGSSLLILVLSTNCHPRHRANGISVEMETAQAAETQAERELKEFNQVNSVNFATYDKLKASGTVSASIQLLRDSLSLIQIQLTTNVIKAKMKLIEIQKKMK